jgi:hypothetical protein
MTQMANRAVELRNFSNDQYFECAADNLMSGSDVFMAKALVRVLGPEVPPGEVPEPIIFANLMSNGLGGWAIHRDFNDPNTTIDGQSLCTFRGEIRDAAGNSLEVTAQLSLADVMGKTLEVAMIWDTHIGVGQLQLWVNGALVAFTDVEEVEFVLNPSTEAAVIGANGGLQASPTTGCAVLSAAYADLTHRTQAHYDAAMASAFLETMKRGLFVDGVDANLGVLDNTLPYVFNVCTPGPVAAQPPTVITNVGAAAPNGDMQRQGDGTTLIVAPSFTVWSGASVLIGGG